MNFSTPKSVSLLLCAAVAAMPFFATAQTQPALKVISPAGGIATTNHPSCGVNGRFVAIEVDATDVRSDQVIFPYHKGGPDYYMKAPLERAGATYEGSDGYGDPGNANEQKETVSFVVASGAAVTVLEDALGGKPLRTLPPDVVKISNPEARLTVVIRRAGDCQ